MVQNPSEIEVPEQKEPVRDIDAEIKEYMGNGKKNFLCSDYPDATLCFQEACSLLSEKYGQMAPECSDAYYYYGSSLLELARMENGVLGNALKGVPDEEQSDENDDQEQFEKPNLEEKERLHLRETVEAAMATEDDDDEGTDNEDKESNSEKSSNEKTEAANDHQKANDKTEVLMSDCKPSNDAKKTTDESDKGEGKCPDQAKTTDNQDSDRPCSSKDDTGTPNQPIEDDINPEDVDPEDVPNMQLAWEMLELAKLLYLKKEKTKENILMVAQCHLKLGELGMELENYNQAGEDFLQCLTLQKEHLASTDRKLAETCYNLGLAFTFDKKYDTAINYYKESLEVLEARVKLLEDIVDDAEVDQDGSMRECKEIGEIKELIPDVYSKIDDVISLNKDATSNTSLDSAHTSKAETTIGFGSGIQQSGDSCSTIPIKKVSRDSPCDINHLVRRKRPSSDIITSADGAGDFKKVKHESSEEKKDKSDVAEITASSGNSDACESKAEDVPSPQSKMDVTSNEPITEKSQ